MTENSPILLGLTGQACTGKSVTAEGLCPLGRNNATNVQDHIAWSHLFFALPLYKLAAARQKIQGEREHDRICYDIQETLFDLFGRSVLFGSLPTYEEFIELVQHLATSYCEPTWQKARTFMQESGSVLRQYDPDIFINWLSRKSNEEFALSVKENPGAKFHGIVVSDVRFPNEAKMIFEHPNGVLIKFVAEDNVRLARAYKRDGHALDDKQASHESEKSVELIPEEYFDIIIDTTGLSVKEQVDEVKSFIRNKYLSSPIMGSLTL